MFSLTTSTTFMAKTNRFKKFGKKMKKQNDTDVGKIREKLSDISRDEQRRVKEIFKEHQEFFKGSQKKEEVAIDFYEN
ncbi:hypothetical protein OlV7_053 [Ostreococcus lucimarinus virus 7]|jgi:hypothetical protein|uniref:hypothetical protein n=1 Tax=Ostreococcus lucimarinus virus 1 TaxID=880162 RepID=UPI0001EF4572|nr:hypothetical protein OlV1_062 [Ostreococcus lucimarinus virus 1]YP_007674842.1 hypothetical protein OLNG_00203 [Ostreococcus lucimarinus virus OlV5]YP_009172547.1 hypothetical protein APZ24_gp056 [Ostreococcus lucimarinus virus 2]YP_009173065.1 hypothetical protein AP054_gp053 [Ostreococcus lucimarinus virus 7]AET84493.1 hypothetical protein OLOG_00029 [Ostreococcus lucimarinus virus OlV4]AFK65951.1 hypothetical protein OLVG_00197 [Ostreococcus lucimarinus virus OlV6]AFK66199.1 hypothetica